MSVNESTSAPRSSKKSGSGKTIALLILVVAATGFIGYYAFIETGVSSEKGKAGRAAVAPSASPPVSPPALPEATPAPAPT